MALPVWRFIHIYIFYFITCATFFFTSYKIIKRNRKNRLNHLLATFLTLISFSMVSNLIYASISNSNMESTVEFLHALSIYLISVSLSFMLLFVLMLNGSRKLITSARNQILFISIYCVLCSGLLFIPNGVNVEILSDGTQMYPVWNLIFFIYYLSIFLPTAIFSLIICGKIYKKMNNEALAKRMRLFIVGISCFYYIGLFVSLTNFINSDPLRIIFTLTGPLAIIGVVLIYISVGKSLQLPPV
ncbi:MAG: hypothetical protein EU539_03170 [Promethearchaeota archaeon]|nr:MAG: hypothetical protein EU539_03170 [Candidatus Lokiarchaeota archaeon]